MGWPACALAQGPGCLLTWRWALGEEAAQQQEATRGSTATDWRGGGRRPEEPPASTSPRIWLLNLRTRLPWRVCARALAGYTSPLTCAGYLTCARYASPLTCSSLCTVWACKGGMPCMHEGRRTQTSKGDLSVSAPPLAHVIVNSHTMLARQGIAQSVGRAVVAPFPRLFACHPQPHTVRARESNGRAAARTAAGGRLTVRLNCPACLPHSLLLRSRTQTYVGKVDGRQHSRLRAPAHEVHCHCHSLCLCPFVSLPLPFPLVCVQHGTRQEDSSCSTACHKQYTAHARKRTTRFCPRAQAALEHRALLRTLLELTAQSASTPASHVA